MTNVDFREDKKEAIYVDVIIIGGGPAGLFTALNISKDKKVLLLEKNGMPGRKLLLSGSGRCNMTHSGAPGEFLKHYGGNYRFLRTALNTFSNEDLIDFSRKRRLYTIIDENGKVFPGSNKAGDVLDMLINECNKNKVTIRCNEPVLEIEKDEKTEIDGGQSVFRVKTKNNRYACNKLVIAAGGKSYPSTGSTGDGYRFAGALGHTLVSPRPVLTPVYVKNYAFVECSGISLPDRMIYLFRDNKKINEHRGDIGFTHKGLSGPGILDFSRYMEKGDVLKVGIVNRKEDDFVRAFVETAEKEGKVTIKRYLKKYEVPDSLLKIIFSALKLASTEKLANINKKTRTSLAGLFCQHPFVIESLGGFKAAMATGGGIPLKEVSSKTMESKRTEGLYFAGEVLDIDGDTGGYNIQAAFSTGFLVAAAINREG